MFCCTVPDSYSIDFNLFVFHSMPSLHIALKRNCFSKYFNLIQFFADINKRFVCWFSACKTSFLFVYGFQEDWFVCGGFQPMADTMIENCNKETLKKCNLLHIQVHEYRRPYVKLRQKNNICKSRNPKLPFPITCDFCFDYKLLDALVHFNSPSRSKKVEIVSAHLL